MTSPSSARGRREPPRRCGCCSCGRSAGSCCSTRRPSPATRPAVTGSPRRCFDLLDALGVAGRRDLGAPVPRLRLRTPAGDGRPRVRRARTGSSPGRCSTRRSSTRPSLAGRSCAGTGSGGWRSTPDRVVLDGEIEARAVVGADGANSAVRRLLGARRPAAVRDRGGDPRLRPASPDPERADDRVRPRALPGVRVVVPAAPDGGANVGYGVFDKRGGGYRVGSCSTRCAGCFPARSPTRPPCAAHHLPLSTGPRFHPDGRVLLVGDAAATVNPLTGEGIFDAVASGVLAGRAALLGAEAGAAHRAAMRRAFGRHHRHAGAMARLAARPRFLDAAVSAAARAPVGLRRRRRSRPGARARSRRPPSPWSLSRLLTWR